MSYLTSVGQHDRSGRRNVQRRDSNAHGNNAEAAQLDADKGAERNVRRFRRHRFSSEIRHELRALSQSKDNLHGIAAAAEDAVIITLAVALSIWTPIFYPLSLVLIGTRHRALATILHESSHFTFCRTRWLNRVFGMIAGWSIFQTFYAYRASHVEEHHPHLGDESRDPDLINYQNQGLFEADARDLVRKHFLPLLLGLKTWVNFGNLVRDRLLPRSWDALPSAAKWEYCGFITFWVVIAATCYHFGLLLELALFWILPYFTVFQATNWLIELAEHFPLIRLYDAELYMTRNRRGPWIERFFTGMHGENWHLVHHLVPGIPFWKLAQAHEIMMKDPVYAAANEKSGGLFMNGPAGEPSIVSLLGEQLTEAQSHTKT